MDRALELFARQGVAGTTVVEIEAAAGLSPGSGSFYRHFENREAVLIAVVDRELARAAAARKERIEEAERLDVMYHRTLDDLARMQPLIEVTAREGRHRPDLLEPLRRVLADDGAKIESALLAERMVRGEIEESDAEAVAAVAMFALVGHHLAEHFFGEPIGVDRSRFVETLARIVRGDAT
ncbi:TetR/AcrR family transcriptional regulator [Mycobacterium sp. IDR2000157661]|uniref:TetR/AcrR family transcriptional regulator n=1 Tax=Mycobacterium sp. IDR2000157661 TaxID=2867005 RepID=UPI001EEBC833|nr:TetR/AcrR family transcriptional regulator [Mycobacterium sp. IDR2000157661]ULE33807.1 TetR/AcrR family transcriptional regulator; helix-turn-helix transcriptional regulator [Mycobacterium sp. IDR2000157661]